MPFIKDQLNGKTPEDLSLQGLPGKTFEEDSQMTTSEIQAFVGIPPTQTLVSSEDIISGRVSTQIPVDRGGFYTAAPTRLSLGGKPGPTFEEESQMTTSDIHAFTGVPPTQTLVGSQDLISGRFSTQIPGAAYFKPASTFPVSIPDGLEGNPYYPALGGVSGAGTYRDLGPRDGRY